MKKIMYVLLGLFCLSVNACNYNPIQTEIQAPDRSAELQKAYDSLTASVETRTMEDFRMTPNLNPDVVLTDYPTADSGRTIITFKGSAIFDNTWNTGTYNSSSKMRTQVKHGFDPISGTYLLWIYNNSWNGSSIFSDYKVIVIKNGTFTNLHWKLEYVKCPPQLYEGKIIMPATNSVMRTTEFPLVINLFDPQTGLMDKSHSVNFVDWHSWP